MRGGVKDSGALAVVTVETSDAFHCNRPAFDRWRLCFDRKPYSSTDDAHVAWLNYPYISHT